MSRTARNILCPPIRQPQPIDEQVGLTSRFGKTDLLRTTQRQPHCRRQINLVTNAYIDRLNTGSRPYRATDDFAFVNQCRSRAAPSAEPLVFAD
jgi:hypothetical protein